MESRLHSSQSYCINGILVHTSRLNYIYGTSVHSSRSQYICDTYDTHFWLEQFLWHRMPELIQRFHGGYRETDQNCE